MYKRKYKIMYLKNKISFNCTYLFIYFTKKTLYITGFTFNVQRRNQKLSSLKCAIHTYKYIHIHTN